MSYSRTCGSLHCWISNAEIAGIAESINRLPTRNMRVPRAERANGSSATGITNVAEPEAFVSAGGARSWPGPTGRAAPATNSAIPAIPAFQILRVSAAPRLRGCAAARLRG